MPKAFITKLDDWSWRMLELCRLDDFFDKHRIPPLLFPLLIALLLITAFVLLSSAPHRAVCGDGICSRVETQEACPADCAPGNQTPAGQQFTVYIAGGLDCTSFDVVLKDAHTAEVLDSQTVAERLAVFSSIRKGSLYANVFSQDSPNTAVVSIAVDSAKGSLEVSLPDNYCPSQRAGTLRVIIREAQTATALTANVALFDSGDTLKEIKAIDGDGTFTGLQTGTWYYLNAMSEGHSEYYGKGNSFFFEGASEQVIELAPMVGPPDASGKLEVCVRGEDGPVEGSGEVWVYGADDSVADIGYLEYAPLFRGQSLGLGCIVFDLPAERHFIASVRKAPIGCSVGQPSEPVIIEKDAKQTIFLDISCDFIGGVRAIAYGGDAVMTQNCTMELYDNANGSKMLTFNMSVEDGYTENVPLKAGSLVYIYAKNVPAGYFETMSRLVNITTGENKTIRIDLAQQSSPPPQLQIQGAFASRQILSRGQMIELAADSVVSQDKELTPADGVTVTCEAYWGQRSSASYNSSWECNLTAPMATGSGKVTITAAKEGAMPDVVDFEVFVVGDASHYLEIEQKQFETRILPVSMWFGVDYTNESGASLPVPQVQESSLLLSFGSSDSQIANLTLTGGNGEFMALFKPPFSGSYKYSLEVKAIIDGEFYTGFKEGTFTVSRGAGASLTCNASPQLVAPHEAIDITAELKMDGEVIPGQRVKATFYRERDEVSYTFTWDPTLQKYRVKVPAPTTECKYQMTCSMLEDTKVSYSTSLYVADDQVSGTDGTKCSYACPSLADVRNCYKLLRSTQSPDASQVSSTMQCAEAGLQECSSVCPPVAAAVTCYQPMKLKVQAKSGSTVKKTDFLYFRVQGPVDSSQLAYSKPQLAGAAYSLVDVYLPGKYSAGPISQLSTAAVSINIDESSGDLFASVYCPLACGEGTGDLNGDCAANDTDEEILKTVTDAVSILGAPPYPEETLTCADVDEDGRITEEDLDCLSKVLNRVYDSFEDCKGCIPTSPTEVCDDVVDNNCDGQADEDMYSETAANFYGFSSNRIRDTCNMWNLQIDSADIRYDGCRNFLKAPTSSSLQIDGEITLEAYINPTGIPHGAASVIMKGQIGSHFEYLMGFDAANLEYRSDWGLWQCAGSVPFNKWSHIAVTVDESPKSIKMYLNGQRLTSCQTASDDASPLTPRSYDLIIGGALATQGYCSYYSLPYTGKIREARIWNDIRTDEEIQQYQDALLNGDEQGLVGYWTFDSGVANDLSGHGNDGQLSGSAKIVRCTDCVPSASATLGSGATGGGTPASGTCAELKYTATAKEYLEAGCYLLGMYEDQAVHQGANQRGYDYLGLLQDLADYSLTYTLVAVAYPPYCNPDPAFRAAYNPDPHGPFATNSNCQFTSYSTFDEVFWTRLDAFLSKADELGIYVEITVIDPAYWGSMTQQQQSAYLQKLYGVTSKYRNVVYKVSNEGSYKTELATVRALVGSSSVISADLGETRGDVGVYDDINLANFHYGRYSPDAGYASFCKKGKPCAQDEDFSPQGWGMRDASNRDPTMHETIAIQTFMKGTHNNHIDWSFWNPAAWGDINRMSSPPPSITYFGNLMKFQSGNEIDFSGITPENFITGYPGGYMSSRSGNDRIVYLWGSKTQETITASVPQDDYNVDVYQLYTGEHYDTQTLSGTALNIQLPQLTGLTGVIMLIRPA